MRIAQVAPLWEQVPPVTYGGTELVVYNLCQELTRRGHEVTLFACKGSGTDARLVPCAPGPLRAMEAQLDHDKTHCTVMAYELSMLQQVFGQAHRFDVIHNHVGFQALPFASLVATPVVTTLHNALSPEPVKTLFLRHSQLAYISISDYQQRLWPELNYIATAYHGIETHRFTPCFETAGKDYFAFLGRVAPEKGPQHAISVARALNMKLILAGKIDRVDRAFYETEIVPHLDGQQIRYIGEVNHAQKVALLRGAAATLHPVTWPEPFGLVMVESMACGTPVLALRDGSIPEVINHNHSGYVADSVEELIAAAHDWQCYDRRKVRRIAERRFSVQRMADDHERIYQQLMEGATMATSPLPSPALHEVSRYTQARRISDPLAEITPALTPTRVAEIRRAAHLPAFTTGATAGIPD